MDKNLELIEKLRTRASIRRQIPNRKSVQNGEPDRIADLLEEAADRIEHIAFGNTALLKEIQHMTGEYMELERMYLEATKQC